MGKLGLLLLSPLLFILPLSAQSRIELGVFIDYLNISQTSTNNFGLGGRFGLT